MTLATVILAAGKGTRMKSALPKVLHPIAGKPMVSHVVDAARALAPQSITVVYGHGGEHVREALSRQALNWALQASMPVHILLTKADKLSRGAAGTVILQVRDALKPFGELTSVQLFSALKHDGHKELTAVLDAWMTELQEEDPR